MPCILYIKFTLKKIPKQKIVKFVQFFIELP